jgi:hypothetical protein
MRVRVLFLTFVSKEKELKFRSLSCRIKGTELRIIYHDENQVEVSFTRTWNPSLEGKAVPLNIDKRCLIHRLISCSTNLIS